MCRFLGWRARYGHKLECKSPGLPIATKALMCRFLRRQERYGRKLECKPP